MRSIPAMHWRRKRRKPTTRLQKAESEAIKARSNTIEYGGRIDRSSHYKYATHRIFVSLCATDNYQNATQNRRFATQNYQNDNRDRAFRSRSSSVVGDLLPPQRS
ncbi:unnamed protein product [Bursaphelenchus okinawaensis]|uniref:Uncharacterized protein n=1 Tax=Bursaphelenchus okinawaensis TaxID=465554 RepID=A0A811LLM3_9BILA|nr:unnamed protein product [Bursaphelenchus okinawaensis]CAG9125910.1 unnamed protein product [Bursaphelenchus okinawaensis]